MECHIHRLSTVISILRLLLFLVPGRIGLSFMFVSVRLAALVLIIVSLATTFVAAHIMAEFSAFATLALAEVAALRSVMSVLVTLPAVVLVAGSLFGIGHTTGKGRIGILSLKRNRDLFALAGFYQFVLLDDQANKLLAVNVSFRISLCIVVVLIFSDIWIHKLVPRPWQ